MDMLKKVRSGIIVSCQALEGEPLHGPMFMAAMARAAKLGGAVGIRTNGCAEVEVCKAITGLPIIGIEKVDLPPKGICITPTLREARCLAAAGADMVAVDARQPRRADIALDELIHGIHAELGVLVMADCATVEDGILAAQYGADVLGSTFGFVAGRYGSAPDFSLIAGLLDLQVPVFAEGGFWNPSEVAEAFSLGVWSVVIGTAITRPLEITRRFVKAAKRRASPC